jgi:hypothetical protein
VLDEVTNGEDVDVVGTHASTEGSHMSWTANDEHEDSQGRMTSAP